MTTSLVLVVLAGAFLHAAWNALIKSGRDKPLDTALMHGLGPVIAVPVLVVAGLPDPASWPYVAASGLVHLAYYVTLAGAYQHGDLGLTYPVMRGSAPLMVTLGGSAWLGEGLTALGMVGVVVLCVGVLLLGAAPGRLAAGDRGRRKALAFAFANAGVIAVYTVIDGLGVRASGNAAGYVALLFTIEGLPYLALVLWRRGERRGAAWAYMARRWPVATLGTCASIGSYGIALWAMTRAPIAAVAALRESSVLFAALIGTLVLKEPFGLRRAAGCGAILAGVVALRLG